MSAAIDITHGNEAIGSVRFVEPTDQLPASRTVGGFKIELPIEITLKRTSGRNRLTMLSGLRAIFSATGSSQELARVKCDQVYIGTHSNSPSALTWVDSLAALAPYEKLRRGARPSFHVTVSGEVSLLREEPNEPLKLDTVPATFFGSSTVEYSAEIWAKMLRTLGVLDIVMIEIPLPPEAPAGWEPVWQEVSHAKAALERGGTTAWRDCALAVRRALEEWRRLEPEQNTQATKPQLRSKSERLDDLRWHLKNFADRPAHTPIEGWSREDVVLMVTTLTALLAIRNS